MANTATFDCNAGMERIFTVGENLSRNSNYDVYFEIDKDVNASTEQRYFRVKKNNTDLFRVLLNDAGGRKPLDCIHQAYHPDVRSNLKEGVEIADTDNERVIYAETNLSADPSMIVILRLVPSAAPSGEDLYRLLSFRSVVATVAFDDGDVDLNLDLNADGGKKPLGGAFFLPADKVDAKAAVHL